MRRAATPTALRGTDPAGDITRRFRAFQASQDPAVLSALIGDLLPLLQGIVEHHREAGGRHDGLEQAAYLGLITAAARYDPDRGTPFAKFARPFITGEIRRYLRGEQSPVRGPRWLSELDGRVRRAIPALSRRVRRPPTLAEIAREINVVELGVLEVLRARSVVRREPTPIRRDRIVHHHYVSFQLPIEDQILVTEAVERLSVLRRKVIFYLFSLDLTQTKVARKLRISQRHRPTTEILVPLCEILGPPRVLGPPALAPVRT